ncbi:MAG: HD domain-containing protein [Thermodesulfovibrionales bacterium]|nr:HD domain-containing protein [Thermodesulfovibrionales bacterium]
MSTKYKILQNEDDHKEENKNDQIIVPATSSPNAISEDRIKTFSYYKEMFFQIERASIFLNSIIDFSIYKQKNMNFSKIIQASKENPVFVEDNIIKLINLDKLCELAIKKEDISTFRTYMNISADSPSGDEKVRSLRKTIAIKENSKILIQDILSNPRSGEKIKEMKSMVNNITQSIIDDKNVIYNMLSLSKYDYYTYTHCLNVSVLSIGLALALGIKGRELKWLAIGSSLHDIGKSAISPEILNKQGKLNQSEYMIIQQHVNEGVKMLTENKEFPKEALTGVLHHHEKISGNGYPMGIKGNDISIDGKIIGIADCYDALTTVRPYKNAMSPFDALHVLAREKQDYDGEMLKAFVKMLGKMWQ